MKENCYGPEQITAFFQNHIPRPIGYHRSFAVLIPLVEEPEGLSFLLEKRAATISQPGEFCFPGGHVEPGETPLDCALREAEEEVGLTAEDLTLLGPGNYIQGYANYTMHTFGALVSPQALERLRLDPQEVEETILLPLDQVIAHPPENHVHPIYTDVTGFPLDKVGASADYGWRVGRWDIPIYTIGGRVIWGLTAQIIWDIAKNLQGDQ